MKSPELKDKSTDRASSSLQPHAFITPGALQLVAAAIIAAGCAAVLPWINTMFAIAIIIVFPVIVVGIYILKNPFNGVFIYFFYEFLRPYDFILALRPLRLSLVIEVVTLFSWILWFIRYRPLLKWDRFNWYYLAFLGSMSIGVFLALNNFRAYNIFQLVLINFVMFTVATNVIDNVKRLEQVVWLLIVTHVYFSLVGIYNYVFNPGMSSGLETSGIVGSSFIADENDFAMAMNVMIPIVFFMSIYYRQRWKKLICLGAGVLFIMAIVASFSRGGLVGLVVTVSFCVWFSGRRAHYFAMALVVGMLFIALSPDKYLGEIETIQDTSEGTADARIKYWTAAGRILIDYPLIGVGAANGGLYMPNYIAGVRDANTQWGRSFHGLFPQVAADLGGIGLILYIIMIYYVVSFLNRIRKRKTENYDELKIKNLALAFWGSIVSFVATSTFLSTAYYPQLWTVYTFSMTLMWIQRGFEERHSVESVVESNSVEGEHPGKLPPLKGAGHL